MSQLGDKKQEAPSNAIEITTHWTSYWDIPPHGTAHLVWRSCWTLAACSRTAEGEWGGCKPFLRRCRGELSCDWWHSAACWPCPLTCHCPSESRLGAILHSEGHTKVTAVQVRVKNADRHIFLAFFVRPWRKTFKYRRVMEPFDLGFKIWQHTIKLSMDIKSPKEDLKCHMQHSCEAQHFP